MSEHVTSDTDAHGAPASVGAPSTHARTHQSAHSSTRSRRAEQRVSPFPDSIPASPCAPNIDTFQDSLPELRDTSRVSPFCARGVKATAFCACFARFAFLRSCPCPPSVEAHRRAFYRVTFHLFYIDLFTCRPLCHYTL